MAKKKDNCFVPIDGKYYFIDRANMSTNSLQRLESLENKIITNKFKENYERFYRPKPWSTNTLLKREYNLEDVEDYKLSVQNSLMKKFVYDSNNKLQFGDDFIDCNQRRFFHFFNPKLDQSILLIMSDNCKVFYYAMLNKNKLHEKIIPSLFIKATADNNFLCLQRIKTEMNRIEYFNYISIIDSNFPHNCYIFTLPLNCLSSRNGLFRTHSYFTAFTVATKKFPHLTSIDSIQSNYICHTLASYSDGIVKLFKHDAGIATRINTKFVLKNDVGILDVRLINELQFVISGCDNLLNLYDLRMINDNPVVKYEHHYNNGKYHQINFYNDILISSGCDDIVRFWNIYNGKLCHYISMEDYLGPNQNNTHLRQAYLANNFIVNYPYNNTVHDTLILADDKEARFLCLEDLL